MKSLSVLIGMTLVAMLVFTTTPAQAKDNPSNSPLCDGLTGKAKGICTAAIAKGCDEGGNQSLNACKMLIRQYKGETGEQPPWISLKRLVNTEVDNDNDGDIDSGTDFTYDENGNWWTMEGYYIDNNGNKVYSSIRYYYYDTDARRMRTEYDFDHDGIIDLVEYYDYLDAYGSFKITVDDGNDGTIERSAHYIYDSEGKEIQYKRDEGDDGTFEFVSYLIYDKKGNRIRTETDTDNDGDIDSVAYYTYDKYGNMTIQEVDSDNNGTIDDTTYFTYYADGYRMTMEMDDDNDGDIDRITYYTYD